MKQFFQRIGCLLIGWNLDVLKQCGESSFRTFRKLVSAITIVMLLWGIIGYTFANRYLNIHSIIGCLGTALVFMTIVLCIERIIILKDGGSKGIYIFRIAIAVCMALLGSFIFDQLMFRNDLEAKIKDNREKLIVETINTRMKVYDDDYRRISMSMDSINHVTDSLSAELQRRPYITLTENSITRGPATIDSLGNKRQEVSRTTTTSHAANPLGMQVNANYEQIVSYNKKLDNLTKQKQVVDSVVREEFRDRPLGFMEELNASIAVISQSWLGFVFYLLLFVFLMFLELFVVSIKWGEDKCDYELMVLHQLELKQLTLKNSKQSLIQKYLTRQFPDDK